MNAKRVEKKEWFGIGATAVAALGAIFMAGMSFCRGAEATNLAPTRSFVLDRVAANPVFSADLQWLAVCQPDRSVEVWNVAKGERAGHWSEGGILAVLPRSGELLVAAGKNITVRELLTGRIVSRLESPANEITSLTVAQAGKVAAGTVRFGHPQLVFWNLTNGQMITRLPTTRYPWGRGVKRSGARVGTPETLPVSMAAGWCRAFSPDGGRFAVGLDYAMVDLWNPLGGDYNHYLGTLPGPDEEKFSSSSLATELAFLDRQRLAVVYNRRVLFVLTLNPSDSEMVQGLPRVLFQAKTPTGQGVAGEVVADTTEGAATLVRQLGLIPTAIESFYAGQKRFYYGATNAAGQPASGVVMATNSAAAVAQVEKLGLTDPVVREISEWRPERERGAVDPSVPALRSCQPLIRGPDLEIRSIAASGDGRRLAVAGMRRGARPGAFFGAGGPGSVVFDQPLYGEVQVWDATELKLLATIKGRPDEKFWDVALDATGRRVAAVTSGVIYNPGMTDVMQQGEELKPHPTRRAYVWDLPKEDLAETAR